jgi:hypothetical protein
MVFNATFNNISVIFRKEIMDLQSKLQFDDPINVQFTSVSIAEYQGSRGPSWS